MYTSKKAVAGMLLIIAAFTLFYFFRGDYSLNPSFTGGVFTLDGPQGLTYTAKFEDVAALKYINDMEPGETLSGGSRYGYRYGTYRNEPLGDYMLCSMSKLNDYIVVTDRDGNTLAFTADNAEATKNLYDAFLELLNEGGFHPET